MMMLLQAVIPEAERSEAIRNRAEVNNGPCPNGLAIPGSRKSAPRNDKRMGLSDSHPRSRTTRASGRPPRSEGNGAPKGADNRSRVLRGHGAGLRDPLTFRRSTSRLFDFGTVLSGRGEGALRHFLMIRRHVSSAFTPASRPAPDQGHAPVVARDGYSGTPGCGGTNPTRRRRALLRLQNVSGRRPS